MKKLTLLSGIAIVGGILAVSTKSSAQITITQADLPSAGLTVTTDSAGSPGLAPGNPSATAQFWDFSSLVNEKAHTINFMAASSSPYGSVAAFAPANLADSTVGGNGYNFFSTTASNFSVVGAEQIQKFTTYSFQIEIGLIPEFEQSGLPGTYGSTVAPSVAKGQEIFSVAITPFSQEKFVINIAYSDTVDAYGTMKMPSGKTYSVLRQKHHETDIDSVYGYFGTWISLETIKTYKNQYDWYANGVGYILAEMDMGTTFDTLAHDIIWDASAPNPTGINEISVKNSVNVYPNPANTQITFNTVSNASQYITIYDVTGRQLERVAVKNGISVLNTGAYSNGVYLFNVTDNSGILLDQGKFVVQH